MSDIRERIESIMHRVAARPGLASVGLGLVAALGYPPVHAWWIALPALALFIVLVHRARTWRAALWQGWLFGWAHLTLANNWIATAFTYQAKMPEVLGWLAVPLLCIYLAIYPALAVGSAKALSDRLAKPGASVVAFGVMLAGTWIVAEWLRSWVFTGYPWPPLGLMLLGGWQAQGFGWLLPFIGTYALSGVAILLVTAVIAMWRRSGPWFALVPALLIAVVMVLPHSGPNDDTDIPYALVQPNIQQDEINDFAKFGEQFERIADLTLPGRDTPRLVLWPESAIPDFLEDGYPQRYYTNMTAAGDPGFARRRLGTITGEGSTLLAGVVNLDIGMREDGTVGAVSARNSVLGLNGAGEITHHYAKEHLVPFGEYLPLREWVEPLGLQRLVAGSIEYEPGPGPRTLDLGPFGRAGVQICYEIVFSGQVVDRADRPDYIFNPSNDGWFGSWGPPQHLAQARMRALEEGLPVLRSTTTGISAVVDADGIVRGAIGRDKAARLDGMIPRAKPPTLFSQFGNAIPLVLAALFILLALVIPRSLALLRSRR